MKENAHYQQVKKADFEPEMVYVEGGTFRMGSPAHEKGRCDDEKPHLVTLGDFLIGKYVITQRQWKAVMMDNPSFNQDDNYPVEDINWDDTQQFLCKLNAATGKNYRLPTEAEWEFAARGGKESKGFLYSGSNNISYVGWHRDNSWGRTHPVGYKRANELGIYDMSGNVWEWCNDWYDEYPKRPQKNPQGPSHGTNRIGRGGSWGDEMSLCRVAYRSYIDPEDRSSLLGFRVVLPL
ncbi:MAG: formylglycine-generating enzyme family protein [Mediterranea sp.]|jgi:formylglycine-generating enzyme required for sulfatase activity|nr:formylglycine-generating enzyme family protein [Mediterranea sp.]